MKILLLSSLFLISTQIFSQSIANDNTGVLYLYRNESNTANSFKRGAYAGDHVLGDTISIKLNEFEKRYIYFKPGSGAYAIEEKVTLKPQIYKSIKRVDNYFSKQFSGNKMSRKESSDRFSAVLDVAIKLINYDTKQVELDLRKINDPLAIEKYLLKIKFSEI